MSVKTGVIGVGYLGRFHAQKYHKLSNLVGVFDVDQDRSREVAEELGVESFASVESLLEAVDAVSVVANTRFHYELGKMVLNQGCHMLLEKPITEDLNQAKELLGLAEEKNVVFQVGHIERVNPGFQLLAAKNWDVQFLDCARLTPFNARGADVDVVLDLMIHDIDLCNTVFQSQPIEVMARGQKIQSETNDVVYADLLYPEGRSARLVASRCSQSPKRAMTGMAAQGFFEVDLASPKLSCSELGGSLSSQEADKADALFVEVEHFLRSVSQGDEILVTAQEAVENLRVAHQICAAIS